MEVFIKGKMGKNRRVLQQNVEGWYNLLPEDYKRSKFHDVAGHMGEEVEDRFLQKQVRERTEASVQLLLAIIAGETETHARGEEDYFPFP